MKVVVTGGAGFIGSNLVRHLAGDPAFASISVLDDLSTGSPSNLAGFDVDFVEGSILNADVLDDLFTDASAVVHLAARPSVPRSIEDPVAAHEINATGTLRVLEAMRRHSLKHIVIASSSSVYGDRPALPKKEMTPSDPLSPYAASKVATEAYGRAYASSFGIGVLVFRFFNVFGPRQPAGHDYAAAIPAFVDAAINGRAIPIYGDGKQTRDFTYVGTVIDVIRDALARGVTAREPVNLALGTRRSLLDVVKDLETVLGRSLEVDHRPPRPGDVRHSQADASLLSELFPDVEPISFEKGLAETVGWFQAVQT